jgi:hypothetical protein
VAKIWPVGVNNCSCRGRVGARVAQRSSRSASTSRSRSHTGAGLKAIFVHEKIMGTTRVQGIWLFFAKIGAAGRQKRQFFCQNDKKLQKISFYSSSVHCLDRSKFISRFAVSSLVCSRTQGIGSNHL